jgi:hypothetical protein
MFWKNFKISSENNEFGGKISGYIDEKFVICSRNFKVLTDKRLFAAYSRLDWR